MTTPNPRPSFPTEEKRFHPFAALRFLRKTLAVYLIPLVNVLFERNWPAFWTALRQDAILFALLCGVSWVILRFSSWQLDEAGVLHLRWKLLFKLDTTIRGEALAALTLERPALFRLGGATKITLYPTGQPQKHVTKRPRRRRKVPHAPNDYRLYRFLPRPRLAGQLLHAHRDRLRRPHLARHRGHGQRLPRHAAAPYRPE